jgi:hypothetical protein
MACSGRFQQSQRPGMRACKDGQEGQVEEEKGLDWRLQTARYKPLLARVCGSFRVSFTAGNANRGKSHADHS